MCVVYRVEPVVQIWPVWVKFKPLCKRTERFGTFWVSNMKTYSFSCVACDIFMFVDQLPPQFSWLIPIFVDRFADLWCSKVGDCFQSCFKLVDVYLCWRASRLFSMIQRSISGLRCVTSPIPAPRWLAIWRMLVCPGKLVSLGATENGWLVVWNICYFPIYGESSSQLTFIFFRRVETTNQMGLESKSFEFHQTSKRNGGYNRQNPESTKAFAVVCMFKRVCVCLRDTGHTTEAMLGLADNSTQLSLESHRISLNPSSADSLAPWGFVSPLVKDSSVQLIQ